MQRFKFYGEFFLIELTFLAWVTVLKKEHHHLLFPIVYNHDFSNSFFRPR